MEEMSVNGMINQCEKLSKKATNRDEKVDDINIKLKSYIKRSRKK